jgi:hypothetical protein
VLCRALRHGGERNLASVFQSETGTAPASIDAKTVYSATIEHDFADVVPGFHPSVGICGTQEREDCR